MTKLTDFERSARLAEVRAVYKSSTKLSERPKIREPRDVVRYLRAIWNLNTLDLLEEFIVICLNNNHQALGWVKVSSGGFGMAQVDQRLVFSIALQTASRAIIMAHNHPSGSLEPAAAQLLTELQTLGVILVAEGDRLRFSPRSAVTGELLQRLRGAKAELLAMLKPQGAGPVTAGPSVTTGDGPQDLQPQDLPGADRHAGDGPQDDHGDAGQAHGDARGGRPSDLAAVRPAAPASTPPAVPSWPPAVPDSILADPIPTCRSCGQRTVVLGQPGRPEGLCFRCWSDRG